MEIDRGGPSYTVMTVEALLAEAAESGRPRREIYLVVGADLVPDLGTWERAEDLQQLVTLAVVSRPPRDARPRDRQGPLASRRPAGWRVEWVDGPLVDVSSSAVRDAAWSGAARSTMWCRPK